ncbi:MAG: chromate transporter [Anaerolineales bacterium]|nr:chromate transporter [Anaerolineales bacterium]
MIYWQIFWLFTRVAFLSWGGGPASLALMQRETVSAQWVTADEFADAVAVGNSLPGPIAPQVSAFVGYKLAGFWGAVAGAVGTVVPTTLLMLTAIAFFYQIKGSPTLKAMLTAVRPVVVGFLLWTAYDLAVTVFKVKTLGWWPAVVGGWDKVVIALVTFGLLTLTPVNPAVIIFGAAALGFLLYR